MAHMKIGFHSSTPGNQTGIGDYFRELDAAKIPAVIKAADSYGVCYELANIARFSNVPHVIVFRLTKAGQNDGKDYDVPNYNIDPATAALNHWNMTKDKLPPEFDRVWTWLELINEVDKNRADWLGRFCVAIAGLAITEGYKVALPGWSSGEPETEHWQTAGMLDFLRMAANNPARIAVALHEYSFDVLDIRRLYPYLIGRFGKLFAVCDANGIRRPSVIMTEWGWELDNVPEPTMAKAHIADIAGVYGLHPEIKGAAIWNLGQYQGDIHNKTQKLIQPVKDLALQWGPPEPTPDPVPPPTGGTMQTRSFNPPWTDLSNRLQQPNGFTLRTLAPGTQLWYPGGNGQVTGTVEALHRQCLNNLPANECKDGTKPLILDGEWTYKFQAVNMASGTSLETTFTGSGRKRVIVPVNVHWQVDTPNETNDVYVVLLLNGVEVDRLQHPELKDRSWMFLIGEADGPVLAQLRFQTSWANSRDCFTDMWTCSDVVTVPPPTIPPPTGATLNETLWNASQAEYAARGIKLPDALGLWKVITAETVGMIPAHNEIGVNYEGQGYALQGAIDPKKVKPYRVYVWNAVKGVWYIEGPEDEPTSPFESWPLGAFSITQAFGANPDWYAEFGLPGHEGIDFSVPIGTPVKTMADGTVYYIYPSATGHNYGKHIRVQHPGGIKTIYCHLDRIDVTLNQTVTAGQTLGLSGNTGNSSGPHLHLAFKKDGVTYVDKAGNSWPSNFINPWPSIKHLYQPPGRQLMSGWVYDFITEGSDGEGVNFSSNLNLRSGPATTFPLLGSVPYLSMIEITGPKTAGGWYPVTAWVVPAAVPPTTVDLLPYLKGDGRQFTVKHSSGAQENFQVQAGPGNQFQLVKNSQYEAFLSDELYIWRGLDTSPGPAPSYAERPGEMRYYRQFETGQQWARWCKRHMTVGETWTGPGHTVQFGYKKDCAASAANSGNATNKVTLVAKHAAKVWNGITVNDVVELRTGTGETMFFGRGWGLVAWSSEWGSSAVLEVVSGEPLNKETGCFG